MTARSSAATTSQRRGRRAYRTGRQPWLNAALETLRREGIDNVRVERLAQDLGVSKGSFYWEFKTRRDLLCAMLDFWEKNLTMDVLRAFSRPLAVHNQKDGKDTRANYRTVGLADMANAITEGRQHRCSLEMSLHVVDVMTSILKAGETGKAVALKTTCERPEALSKSEAKAMLNKKPAGKK